MSRNRAAWGIAGLVNAQEKTAKKKREKKKWSEGETTTRELLNFLRRLLQTPTHFLSSESDLMKPERKER